MKLTITMEVDPEDDPEGWLDPSHEMGLTEEGYINLPDIFPFGCDDISVTRG